MIMRSAVDRVIRTLALSVGIGALCFTLLGVPQMIDQFDLLNPVYAVTCILVFAGLPPLMAILSFRISVRALQILAYVHASTALLFVAFWVPAMTVEVMPDRQLPWIINTITVATCMAATTLPFGWAWVYVVVTAMLSGALRYVTYGAGDPTPAMQDTIMIILISGFMAALIQLSRRAGVEQDAAAVVARNAAAAHAAEETLERQRTRYHAFTHDDVLAAFQDGPVPSEVTRRSAALTLEKMDRFRDDLSIAPSLNLVEFDSHLRGAAQAQGLPYASSLTAPGAPALEIPIEVSDALTEAFTEAMRNSQRHADWPDSRPVSRSTRASRTKKGIRLEVTDDGRGFSPRRVGLDRLGVHLSILQRVNSQPGGHASITSSRGNGTTVTLTWTAQGR
jgi:signal transduction histidine kinase